MESEHVSAFYSHLFYSHLYGGPESGVKERAHHREGLDLTPGASEAYRAPRAIHLFDPGLGREGRP